MEYNLANQMTSAKGTNTYLYDGFNRRVKQTDAKGTSYSVYSQSGTLLMRETNQGKINYIYLAGKLISKVGISESPDTSNQHYAPFGSVIEGEKDAVGYTGHKFDTDIGLSYMQARYYDPVIGRFYSNDPVGAASFLSAGNIHGFNRYTYANNNPYKYIDPDGNNPRRWLFNLLKDPKVTIGNGVSRVKKTARDIGILPPIVQSAPWPSDVPPPWVGTHPDEWSQETFAEVAKACKQQCIDENTPDDSYPQKDGPFIDKVLKCTRICIEETMEDSSDVPKREPSEEDIDIPKEEPE